MAVNSYDSLKGLGALTEGATGLYGDNLGLDPNVARAFIHLIH
jgi:hypothetical protein